MRRRWLGIALPWVFAFCLLGSGSALAEVRLGLGGDYWINRGGVFSGTLAIDARLVRHLSIGARFGALVATYPTLVGAPIDLDVRLNFGQVYVEGLLGPWILFTDNPVRAHAALGFGLQTGGLCFGLEVGWLDPDPMIGLRLGFRL